MNDMRHPQSEPPPGSFWKTKAGVILLAFLGVSLLMLAYEHRVHLLAGNAGLLLLLLACGAMHLFMHHGHGEHGGGGHGPGDGERK